MKTITKEARFLNVVAHYKENLRKGISTTLKSECAKVHVNHKLFFKWAKEQNIDGRQIAKEILLQTTQNNQETTQNNRAAEETPQDEPTPTPKPYQVNANIRTAFRHKVVAKAMECRQLMINYLKKQYEGITSLNWNNIEDAIEDVYFRLLTEPSTLKIDIEDESKFRTLMCIKAKQSMMNLRKKNKANSRCTTDVAAWSNILPSSSTDPMQELEEADLKNIVNDVVNTFPKEAQQMLILHYDGTNARDVMRELHMTPSTYHKSLEEFTEIAQTMVAEQMGVYGYAV